MSRAAKMPTPAQHSTQPPSELGLHATAATAAPVTTAMAQPKAFESRRMSGSSRSAPSQSTSRPLLVAPSEPGVSAARLFAASLDPSVSDHTSDGVAPFSKIRSNPHHADPHSATSQQPFQNPQSPIRRVVRAANKSRRRLKVASADAFTLEAIQRRLNIFRDPASPQGVNGAPNDAACVPLNNPASTTTSASTGGTIVSKSTSSHSRPTLSNFPASSNSPQILAPFTPSQSQSNQHPRLPRNSANAQTDSTERQHRRKTGPRGKQDLPPRPTSNTSPRLVVAKAGAPVAGEGIVRSPQPLESTSACRKARPTSMSGMSNEKEFENMSSQLSSSQQPQQHAGHDYHLHNDFCSTSKTNSYADSSFKSPNTTTDFAGYQQEQPNLPRLNSRRRSETREMLLSFPEHDAVTVHKLIAHFKGDHKRVHEMLAKEREQHQRQQQQQQNDQPDRNRGQMNQEQHRKNSNVDQQQVLKPPLPPPLRLPPSRDWGHRKNERSRSVYSEDQNVRKLSNTKPKNGSVFAASSPKQSQLTGTKRRRGDSRDESSGKVTGPFGQIQSPITNFFSGPECTNDQTHGKSKSRLHLRSRFRRARAGKFQGHCDTDGDGEHDRNSPELPPCGVVLPKPENRDGFGDSSQDDINKCDQSHESDTSTSSNTVATTETTCSVLTNTNLDDSKSQEDKPQIEAWGRVRTLQRTVSKLEKRLAELEGDNRRTRQQISCRLDAAMRDMSTIEKRHDGLCTEVDDNIIRVGKTEQYLDAMRRDLLLIVGQRQWAVWRIVRTAVNNVLYYFLAYLVPILAFVVRLIRDVVVSIRRRRLTSAT